MNRLLIGITLAAVFVAAGVFFYPASAEEIDSGLPKSHWQKPLPAQGEAPDHWPKQWRDLSPQACAQCHEDQFRSWKESLHAHSFSAGLIGQFPGMGVQGSNSCLNCHAPLAEQKLTTSADITEALAKQQAGAEKLPLRHAGVSCASCHVRSWKRFGPPPTDSKKTGWVKGPAHDGFYATKAFEQSQFCASCHQFPQSMAVNGKPLENTVEEWRASRFAAEGVHCQSCHMPDRRHEFRGIHDPAMTRKGLSFSLHKTGGNGELRIKSIWIGHAFPTYVTPKVVIEAEATDEKGHSLKTWQWNIVREVAFTGSWQEIRDERLMPGESRTFRPDILPAGTQKLAYSVRVLPDEFYKGVYRGLLSSALTPLARNQIQAALEHADANDYVLYEGELAFP